MERCMHVSDKQINDIINVYFHYGAKISYVFSLAKEGLEAYRYHSKVHIYMLKDAGLFKISAALKNLGGSCKFFQIYECGRSSANFFCKSSFFSCLFFY